MMFAKERFEKLGYTQTRDDEDYIIYEKSVSGGDKKIVDFCMQTESFSVHYEDTDNQVPSIKMDLMMAIWQQLMELPWDKGGEVCLPCI